MARTAVPRPTVLPEPAFSPDVSDSEELPVEVPQAIEESKSHSLAQIARISVLDQQKAYFAKQPKRRIRVRKDISQGDVPVQVNGYTFLIMPDVWVEVPEDVAQYLEDANYL